MDLWRLGPVEKQIAPPLKDAITVYTDFGPIVIYIGNGPFHRIPASRDEVKGFAIRIVQALNGIGGRP